MYFFFFLIEAFQFKFSEKAMAPHSSTLAWKIPWMEEPGRLQSMGSHRVGHDWANSFSLFTFMHWRRKWQPTPVFLPGESQGWGSLVGCCLWVAQSRTRLKWLSSSSSSSSSSSFIPSWSLLALPWFLIPVLCIFLCRSVFLVAIISVDRFYCSFPPCFFSYSIFVSILCQLL